MLQSFWKTAAKRAGWTQEGPLILLPSAVPGSMSEDDRPWKEFESSKLRVKDNSTIADAGRIVNCQELLPA